MPPESRLPPGGRHGPGRYQMLWDCRFCGTQKLLGITHRHCPNCGAAQDPAWRYFPAEEDMVPVENHPFVGADKICPACSQPNSAANTYCSECGADLATGKVVQTQGTREIGTGPALSDTRRDVVAEQFEAEMQRVGAASQGGAGFLGLRKKEWAIVGGVLLLMLLIVGIVFAVTYRREVSGTVTRLSWERTIEIQDFQPRSGGDWDESVPADAYNRSCSTRQRGTERVKVGSHQECRDVDDGDGGFSRECRTVDEYEDRPVYDTWCSYTVDRWAYKRKVTASGSSKNDPPPSWPTYTLASGSGRYGQEREGPRHETYTLVIKADGKDRTCKFDEQARWDRYTVGMAVDVKLYITGHPDCDTITIAQ